MSWWRRSEARPTLATEQKRSVPSGVWTKCAGCAEIVVEADLRQAYGVCQACGHHHPLGARERLEMLLDPQSFEELAGGTEPLDPLSFKDTKRYKDRLKAARKKSGYTESAVVGVGRLEGRPVALGALAFDFIGGSMGSVMGERIARLFEAGVERRVPVVVCSASGGARMQEGILSLMQMAKTAAAISRLRAAGLPYISILCHPTTGGVAASFAMLGDIHIAEPGALIGFAGPRVIEQTIRQKLPEGFQRSEFLLDHGMVDMIVPRGELKQKLARILALLAPVDLSA